MYRTCIFCYQDLGQNQSIEACPVGRRLAYDPAKGRLWVVCRHCERWNLTPFEERWEALEDCERHYRGTRLRYSTANVGLARVGEGLELVRIGEPLRPELAAWRYGDQFGRRRRRYLVLTGLTLVSVPVVTVGAFSALAAIGVSGSLVLNSVLHTRNFLRRKRTVTTLPPIETRSALKLTRAQLDEVQIMSEGLEQWHLSIPASADILMGDRLVLRGESALAALRHILPHINRGGGSRQVVSDAVQRLEEIPDAPAQIWKMAAAAGRRWHGGLDHTLAGQPTEHRLALEMLLREEHEERSLRGELWRLEREWRTAEEIASIADTLLSTPAETEHLERLRAGELAR